MSESLGEMFAESAKKYASNTALKVRKENGFDAVSYIGLSNLVREFGSGLLSLDVLPHDRIFILSDNRKEWLVVDLAILSIGAINVSRGKDSTASEIEYIIKHSNPRVVIVETRQQLEKVTSLKDTSFVEKIVVIEDNVVMSEEEDLLSYGEILARGKQLQGKGDISFESRLAKVKKEDPATIVYTSGTTAAPKGVMLTHHNILSNIQATLQSVEITSDDRFLSILPSWHMFERTTEYILLSRGATMIYTGPRTLGTDMISEKPTYMVSVPRIWEVLYEKIKKGIREGKTLKKNMATVFLNIGIRYTLAKRAALNEKIRLEEGWRINFVAEILKGWITRLLLLPLFLVGDIVVFSKIKKSIGGCFKAGINGGGSFPSYLEDFFEAVGITILNGYGLTETSPIISVRTLNHNIRGTIGRPIADTEVKIVDEEGKEVPKGIQGLICVRGSQVMHGYYKDEETTAKVMMDEGRWFNTGDLGKMTISGDIVITGRAKDTIVLSGGENVEPEPIEIILRKSKYMENVIVVGQDQKYLSALISPDYLALSEYLNMEVSTPEEVMADRRVKELIRKEITSRINEESGFKAYEKIIKFKLVEEKWTLESGLLTPTLKVKRNIAAERYKHLIEKMYT